MGLCVFDFPWDKNLCESKVWIYPQSWVEGMKSMQKSMHIFWASGLCGGSWALVPSATAYQELAFMKIDMTKALSSGSRKKADGD